MSDTKIRIVTKEQAHLLREMGIRVEQRFVAYPNGLEPEQKPKSTVSKKRRKRRRRKKQNMVSPGPNGMLITLGHRKPQRGLVRDLWLALNQYTAKGSSPISFNTAASVLSKQLPLDEEHTRMKLSDLFRCDYIRYITRDGETIKAEVSKNGHA